MNVTIFNLDIDLGLGGLIVPVQQTGLISRQDFVTITTSLYGVMTFIALLGMAANGISARTFVLLGVKDGVSVSLMALTLSDLGYITSVFFLCSSSLVNVVETKYGLRSLPVQPKGVVSLFAVNTSQIFNMATGLTTTFLGVARCMSFAMPFRFRDFFTRDRSLLVQVVFLLVVLASYIPVLSQQGTQRGFDAAVNRTRVIAWMSSQRSQFKDAAVVFHYIVLNFLTLIVVFVCVLIMAKYLKQSLAFRNVATAAADNNYNISGSSKDNTDDVKGGRRKKQEKAQSPAASGTTKNDSTGTTGSSSSSSIRTSDRDVKLSGKELQAVRQVMLICTIYTVCIMPGIFIALYRPLDKHFDVRKRLHNLYIISADIRTLFNLVNSATTFLVYYSYNSKFRSVCFSCHRVSVKK